MILAEAMSSSPALWAAAISAVVSTAAGIFALFYTRREFEASKGEIDRRLATHEQVHTKHEEVHKDIFKKLGGVERGGKSDTDSKIGELRREVNGLRDELPEMERRLNAGSEQRAADTHKRINDVLEAVARLDGQINSHR